LWATQPHSAELPDDAGLAGELVDLVQRADVGVAGIGLQLARRVGEHRADLRRDLLRRIGDEDRVAVALGHLAAVGAGHARALLRRDGRRFDEAVTIRVVEAPHDLARELEMRQLVLAHRHEIGAHDGDVGGLQQRVHEEAEVAEVLVRDLLALLLVARHALQPRHRRDHREVQRQLGDLEHVGLPVDGADRRVEPGGDPVEHHVLGRLPDAGGVRPVGRQGVPVGDEVERVILVLGGEHVLEVPEPVAEVQLAGGTVPGEDALLRHVARGSLDTREARRSYHSSAGRRGGERLSHRA
jgi:hypothetical protein